MERYKDQDSFSPSRYVANAVVSGFGMIVIGGAGVFMSLTLLSGLVTLLVVILADDPRPAAFSMTMMLLSSVATVVIMVAIAMLLIFAAVVHLATIFVRRLDLD